MSDWDPFAGVPKKLGKDDRFEVGDRVGSGGIAVVHEAYDTRDKKKIAIKLFEAPMFDKHDHGERFKAEATAMAKLRHPALVQVFAAGRASGFYWYAMELMEGGTIRDLVMKEGPLPVDKAFSLGRGLLEAVRAVHDAGMVHRDIKPRNVLLDAKGRPRLADFGIARHPEGSVPFKTRAEHSMGSIGYTSPEQRQNPHDVSWAADIFSVGATLYYLVTGQRPDSLSVQDRPSDIYDPVPEAVRDIVIKATAYEAGDRYQTAAEMLDAMPAAKKKSWLSRFWSG